MKLYNMDKDEWRGHCTKGDSWRSTIAYQCQICGAKTNSWFMGGYCSIGPRIICPADGTTKHETLEKFALRLEKIKEKIKDYKKGNLVNLLNEEKEIIEERIKKLQAKIKCDDVKGDVQGVKQFWPTSRINS